MCDELTCKKWDKYQREKSIDLEFIDDSLLNYGDLDRELKVNVKHNHGRICTVRNPLFYIPQKFLRSLVIAN